MTLKAKEIPFQMCESEMINKAQWHLDANGGYVPLLESPDGMIINESAVIMDFCNDIAPQGQGLDLWPHQSNPGDIKASMQTAKMKLQMQRFDKKLAPYFAKGMFRMYKEEESMTDLIENGLPEFEKFVTENTNGGEYLSGTDSPMYLDIHVFPILERMVLLEGSPWDYAAKELDL